MITRPLKTVLYEIALLLEPMYESSQHAHLVAWWLLEGVTKKNRTQLILQTSLLLTDEQLKKLQSWIHAHTVEQYPLQYLLGAVDFGPLEILVAAPTLIPRPETEEWCFNLIKSLSPLAHAPLRILDMCTGSGCIALWLAQALPHSTIYGVDISDAALTLAEKNATHNKISNVRFFKSNLFEVLNHEVPFDLIVSNPPYINPNVWHELSPMVSRWEDRGALVAANQGLEIIQSLVRTAPRFLTTQSPLTILGIPRLMIEIGYDQGPAVQELFIDAGFGTVRVLTDSAERDRVVLGW
jgi:release factor glutamine methyltransferase